jgi:hypothetical protein
MDGKIDAPTSIGWLIERSGFVCLGNGKDEDKMKEGLIDPLFSVIKTHCQSCVVQLFHSRSFEETNDSLSDACTTPPRVNQAHIINT